jgi:hypothetical protein
VPGKLDGEANKLDATAAWDRHEFYGYPGNTRGRVMFQRLQHMQQPQHGKLVASNRSSVKIFAMVGGLRPAPSAVQKRNRLLTNSSEMNDSCQSPGNYEKFAGDQARLFRPVDSGVAHSAQHARPAREQLSLTA